MLRKVSGSVAGKEFADRPRLGAVPSTDRGNTGLKGMTGGAQFGNYEIYRAR